MLHVTVIPQRTQETSARSGVTAVVVGQKQRLCSSVRMLFGYYRVISAFSKVVTYTKGNGI